MIIFIFKFIFIVQFANLVKESYASYDNHVAFYCGHPSMIYKNGKWIIDINQSCIKDEMGIVSYCQKIFTDKNISSAEPAIEKLNFTKWCDFDNEKCDYNVQVRPFKCLEANFQSDALTLPKNCLFAHLGGKGDCKIYKDWVLDAKIECSKKTNWEVRSYGMLFQCSKSQNTITPMFFRGVEFVCCPIEKSKTIPMKVNEQNIYKDYLKNGVLDTEKSEDKVYEEARQKLDQSEKDMKNDIIKDYKSGQNDLKELWNSDPNLALYKEKTLISQFKLAYNAIIDQYTSNKEKLLNFHDERLKFIFSAKSETALKQLDNILKNPVKNEEDIREAMKQVLYLLMIRKKEILEERATDESLGSHMLSSLDKELNFIESTITNVFKKLNQVPQWKRSIKQHLVMYLLSTFPRISFERTPKNDNRNSEISKIISLYKHRPDTDDDNQFIHYDLGLHDKDQADHFGHSGKKFMFDHEAMEKKYGHKKLLFGLLSGIVGTAIMIMLLGFILIMYRHRSTRYTQPSFQEQSKHMMKGFGGQVESSAVSKDVINAKPFNVYENPTYRVTQTTLNTVVTAAEIDSNEIVDENMALPLIQS